MADSWEKMGEKTEKETGLKKFGKFCARQLGGLALGLGGGAAMAGGIMFMALAAGFTLLAITGGGLAAVAAFASTLPVTLSLMAGGGAVAFGGMKLAETGGRKFEEPSTYAAPEAASGFNNKKLGPAFAAAQDNNPNVALDLAPLAVLAMSSRI